MEIECPAPECQYKTPKMEAQLAMDLLKIHNSSVHGTGGNSSRKAECIKRPEITLDMSEAAWRDFELQWIRYKRSAALSGLDIIDQLISCCSDVLRMDINSEYGNQLNNMTEKELSDGIKSMAVRKTNPMVHRNKMRDIRQGENELYRNFVSRLKEAAIDCNFHVKCTKEGCDTKVPYAEDMIRDQAIYGISCADTQAKILAASIDLPSLSDVIKTAEAEEQAKRTQERINHASESQVSARRSTPYKTQARERQLQVQACNYCGKNGHGKTPNKKERKDHCPAWGKLCGNCGKKGHLDIVCRLKRLRDTSGERDAHTVLSNAVFCPLIGTIGTKQHTASQLKLDHVEWDKNRGWYRTLPVKMPRIKVNVEIICDQRVIQNPYALLSSPTLETLSEGVYSCTADTGAQVTIAGPSLMKHFKLQRQDLIPVSQRISAASDTQMTIIGALAAKITLADESPSRSTWQLCYIAKECTDMYLSHHACKTLGIVHDEFPRPAKISGLDSSRQEDAASISDTPLNDCRRVNLPHQHPLAPCGCPVRSKPPALPTKLPVPLSDVGELKKWIMAHYAASAFNTCSCQPLPSMHGQPLVVALKPDATPSAIHVPAPVPIHYQSEVKKGLDRDVALGVLEKVPVNTPVEWLHRMVITPKKDGTPRRTVDLQTLNQASVRQTHFTPTPYHATASIPENVKKTCLDAWNGYHSVLLDEKSRKMTSFITPWGVYRYRTAPQGYHASGDAYTHRYDNIIQDFENITKCVDDVCLWDDSVEGNFLRTCRYLDLCARNGIVFNPDKFVFCQDEVEFLGFTVTKNSMKPCGDMLTSIQEFPTPTDISGIRSIFGLVNQVSYAFSMTEAMAPFRALLKPTNTFYWDDALQKLFDKSKTEIVKKIVHGVFMFDTSKITCLATDWSKTGIGFFLTQKHCDCQEITPICCKEGWKLVLAGSRFTKSAESRYHPVEGEALAVAYALHKTRYFVLGCKQLIVATDHKPLLKIFGDRNLEDISNPRLLNFKEKTLQYRFSIVHVPGRKHTAPDSMSRNAVQSQEQDSERTCLDAIRIVDHDDTSDYMDPAQVVLISAINTIQAVSIDRVEHETTRDAGLQQLIRVIQSGFPECKEKCPNEVREFFRYRDHLSVADGIILFKSRALIPRSLRQEVLEHLHSAHQGVQGMKARAEECVFWPGISAAINNIRDRCKTCNTITPSHSAEPPITPDPPQYPYEQVCADYFELGGITYLAMADRYSGWLSVKCFPKGSASAASLVTTLRDWFMVFGAPKELSSDGGTTFMAELTQRFFKNWSIRHRVSSVAFPHSNCRAELAVKTAKRLIRDNVGPHGSLDTDKFARALLQYRNTPIQGIELSPAQILLGRQLRDFFPFINGKGQIRKEWQITADDREKALARRHIRDMERLSLKTHELPSLNIGDSVLVQNQVGNYPTRWERTGIIVELGPGPRQYYIRMDGSGQISLRNRRFLRRCRTVADLPVPSKTPPMTTKQAETNSSPPSQGPPVNRSSQLENVRHSDTPIPCGPEDHTVPMDLLPDTLSSDTPQPPQTSRTPTRSSTPSSPRRSNRPRKSPDYLKDYVTG